MPIVSFLSGWSYAHEKLCLASPDAVVRERAVERLWSYIAYAAPLRAVLVVGLMQGLRSDEPDAALAANRIAECLRRAADRAAILGVMLVIEPVNHLQVGFHHTAAETAELVKRVGSPALGYMLDTIHMHIEERSVDETIRKHGRQISHFHLCESNGGQFGTGGIDFPQVLTALRTSGYDRYVSVKIYRQLGWEEAARTAAERILPLMAR
jgi:sugar phosphate isomerase/epimerase